MSTKQVKRNLTSSEVLACFDVPVGMAKALEKEIASNTVSLSQDMGSQPPAKVLQFAFDVMYQEQKEVNSSVGTLSVPLLPKSDSDLSMFDPDVVLNHLPF